MDKKWLYMPIFLMGVIILFVVSMMFGANTYSLNTVYNAIFNTDLSIHEHRILYDIRLPRVLIALLTGFMISIAGLLLQTITQNVLSEPSILGVNAGANFSIILATIVLPSVTFFTIVLSGFIGGLIVSVFILAFTRRQSPTHLILAGAGISLLLYAMTDFLVITNNLGQYIAFFTAGGAAGQSLQHVMYMIPILLLLIIILIMISQELDVFMFSEEMRQSLGQNQLLYRWIGILAAIILASISVAMVGNIVFLGLLVPHMTKLLFGYTHKFTIIYTGLLGAIVFMGSDTVARVLNETPVNAVIACIGVPFFIYMIKKRGQQYGL